MHGFLHGTVGKWWHREKKSLHSQATVLQASDGGVGMHGRGQSGVADEWAVPDALPDSEKSTDGLLHSEKCTDELLHLCSLRMARRPSQGTRGAVLRASKSTQLRAVGSEPLYSKPAEYRWAPSGFGLGGRGAQGCFKLVDR
jgi:hypothetical protein